MGEVIGANTISNFSAFRYIRLSDFGLSAIIKSSRCTSLSGTGPYVAPEVIKDQEGSGHGPSVDFWGLGILCYVIMTLTTPFYSPDRNELFKMILNDPVPYDLVQDKLSPKAMMFIKGVCTVIYVTQ